MVGDSDTLFPLTLALSLGERETCRPVHGLNARQRTSRLSVNPKNPTIGLREMESA